jgi:transcriptional regulator GlxA family with amidase domain
MAGAKTEDVYAQILEMFEELSDEFDRAGKEQAALKARMDSNPTLRDMEQTLRLDERIGDMRSAILSDMHRVNAENKAGFRRELDEALDEKLPAMIEAEIERRDAIQREHNERRWEKIRNRAQTIIAVVSMVTAVWALLELFGRS